MTAIVRTIGAARVLAADGQALVSGARSLIIDFQDMPLGGIQVFWSGAGSPPTGAGFQIHASLFPDEPTFDECEIDGGFIALDAAASAGRLWIRDRLAFRYAQVRVVGAPTQGVWSVAAMGKKS